MAERHDYSEIIAEMLIQLQQHGTELKRQSEIQTQILERMERSEAGFNNFALAVLDHFQEIKTDLRDVKTDVSQLKNEVGSLKEEVKQIKVELGQVKEEVSQVKAEVSQVKDEVSQVKEEVSQVKDEVSGLKLEQRRTTAALEHFADHEERLRRLEDFMRRAS